MRVAASGNGEHMQRKLVIAFGLLFCLCVRIQGQEGASTLHAAGWTIKAEPAAGEISVSHDATGALLEHTTLNVRDDQGLYAVRGWTASIVSPTRLVLHKTNPPAAWQFEVDANLLKISSTSLNTVFVAQVPAPPDRIPARLLDPLGVPVSWEGTAEVQHGYGGSITRNPSTLPRTNPECMYFQLGQVDSSLFHELFDRSVDVAIRFPEQSRLVRDPGNPDILRIELPVPGNSLVRLIPDYYTKTLGLPFYQRYDDSIFKTAPMVWSSWTSYYENVREEDMVRNTDWIAERLRPYGFQYVELDDGYDRGAHGEHYWFENWDNQKFPHGAKWLTDYIKSKGLQPGLWLVPNAYAGAVTTHPDWYVRDKAGKFVLDYQTPALDSTNPQVLSFVQEMFHHLDGMGFEYYKFDGEHAFPLYAPVVDRSKLHDPQADLVANFRERLKLIRDVIGPQRFVESCPAGTPLNSIGFADSYFNGDDLYASWQGMYPLFSSINANVFFNHIATYLMPGEGLELGSPMTVEEASKKRLPIVLETAKSREDPVMGFGVTDAEARTLVSYVALTGVAYPLASVMPELPEERVHLLQATLPTLAIYPVDLFSRGTDARWDTFRTERPDYYVHNYPEILDLKVNSAAGKYDVVALTNWRSVAVKRQIDFAEQLGLDSKESYVVFDFWNQKSLGVEDKKLSLQLEPHDTRVLLIHPLESHPQLLALSRHISGSYSLRELKWEAATNTLSGTSDSVPGDPYVLWFHIPDGFSSEEIQVTSADRQLSFDKEPLDGLLKLSFRGVSAPVQWTVHFHAK